MNKVIEQRVREHLDFAIESKIINDFNWFFIAPYGSMNYGLYGASSDVDTKILKIPDMRELIENIGSRKVLTNTLTLDNEKIEIKDIREYSRILKNGAINFVELLFSDYVLVNPSYSVEWQLLKSKREALARIYPNRTLSAALGMAKGKYSALQKSNYGNCNLKDFITILRLQFFVENYVKNVEYKHCITVENLPKVKNVLLQLKNKQLLSEKSYELVLQEAELSLNEIEKVVKENLTTETENVELNDFLYEINKMLILKRIN